MAFIGFGSPRFDFYGGDRKGNNLFANSLVAIDARTGNRLWHHQLIHHDLWDWDIPQSAKLLTIRQNGKPRQVVAQATKQGFLFVFDRRTRSADLAHRGAEGAADRRAGRVDVADAAVPDEAGAVRQAVVHREGHQPVPAEGGAGRAARAAAVVSQRGPVHPAQLRRLGPDARAQRRRELRHERGRSRPRRVLRRPQVAADDDQGVAAGATARRRAWSWRWWWRWWPRRRQRPRHARAEGGADGAGQGARGRR